MRRTGMVAVSVLVLAGCGSGGGSSTRGSTSAATTSAPAPGSASPSAVNLLAAITAGGSSASAAPAAPASPAPASPAPASPAPAAPASPASPAPASGPAPASPAPAAPAGPALHGLIPPDPTTGFNGSLYFVGERLVPGSSILVTVNGIPTKVLPALFLGSDSLSTYVHLTVPADYEFAALAPNGTTSTPVRVTVPNGGPLANLGLTSPDVQMAFPTRLEVGFTGVVWLMGRGFVPGAVATIQQPGLLPQVTPLVFLNERTVGWVPGLLVTGSATVTVTNPTFLSSAPVTFTVGVPAPAGSTPHSVSFPSGVSAPFLGSVHLVGAGIELGAVVEHRPVGTTAALTTALLRISPAEAWWSLLYPLPGQYEARVVNPGGAASPWQPFTVR